MAGTALWEAGVCLEEARRSLRMRRTQIPLAALAIRNCHVSRIDSVC
jgi:hypothetical protein